MKRVVLGAGVLAVAAVIAVVAGILILRSFESPKMAKADFAGRCAPVAGIVGPEDIHIDPERRLAFISSLDRRATPKDKERGAIHVFSLDDPLAADGWRDRTAGVPERFQPLGVSFYSDAETRRLFVVNGATKAVDLFDVAENGDLAFVESIGERRLTSPNDIVAVGPRAFYVSNDLEPGRESPLGRAQFLLRIGSGKVFYFDGVAWRVAAEGLRFANGLGVNKEGDRLYAAETAGAAVKIYDRNPETGAVRLAETVKMPAAVDNINVDDAGSLWIGAHPKPLSLSAYAGNAIDKAPSAVFRMEDVARSSTPPVAVYTDDGSTISASSVAARLGSTLLIGSLYEKKFLLCDLPA